jgi:hypothetical protein
MPGKKYSSVSTLLGTGFGAKMVKKNANTVVSQNNIYNEPNLGGLTQPSTQPQNPNLAATLPTR